MKKQLLLILLLLLQSLVTFIPNVSADDPYMFLITSRGDYTNHTFLDLGVYYTPESLTNFHMPFVVEKKGVFNNLDKYDLDGRLDKKHGAFDKRFINYDFKILDENKDYYVIDFTMNTKASNESFNVDFIPKIKNVEFPQFAWWNSSWDYNIPMRINSSYIETTLSNFPLLVVINSTIAAGCQANGEDIRFVADDNTTEFYYDIELWNAAGDSFVWVNVTTVKASSDTYVNLYYGNNIVAAGTDMDNTWHSNFSAVYHMNASSSTDQSDSSGYGHTLTNHGSHLQYSGGKIGYCIIFNSVDDYFNLTSHVDFNMSDEEFTLVAWGQSSYGAYLNWRTLMYKGSVNRRFSLMGIRKTALPGFSHIELDDLATDPMVKSYNYVSDGQWHYYVVTRRNDVYGAGQDELCFRVNETKNESDIGNFGSIDDPGDFALGADADGNGKWDGNMDEVWVIKGEGWNNSLSQAHFNNTNQTIGFLNMQGEISEITIIAAYPTNGATNIPLTPTLSMTISHSVGKAMNMTWYSNSSGSWVAFGHNLSVGNGPYFQSNSNFSSYDAYYFWNVSIDSGGMVHNSVTYQFSTPFYPGTPTNVDTTFWQYNLNITWTNGTRADRTIVVRNNNSEPTSVTDGWVAYNGSLLYYNDTDVHNRSWFKLFGYNSTIQLYSLGILAPWGGMKINTYNESNLSQNISNWNIHIKNQDGSQTYTSYNNNNPHIIDVGNIPIGTNISIKVWADDYEQRLKTADLFENQVYNINFYLPPSEITVNNQSISTPIYYIRVVETYETSSGSFAMAVENAKVTFQRYINTTGNYENISSLLTDANGYVNLYLIPSESYQVVLTKPGHTTKISDYLPQPPNEYGQTIEKVFRIYQTEAEGEPVEEIQMDTMVLSPYNSTTMQIYYLNLNDDNNYVIFNIYDHIGSSLLTSYNISVNPDNISIYFNFSGYNILRVQANAVRLNGTVYTIVKYFNADQARDRTSMAPIAVIFSIGICLFGLTIAHPKKVFGFVGIITMIIAIAITAFAEQVWYIHLIQAVEFILLLVIILIFREEGVHAV